MDKRKLQQHLLNLDGWLGGVGMYTGWNAPYDAEQCRAYSQRVREEASAIARLFRAGLEEPVGAKPGPRAVVRLIIFAHFLRSSDET